MRDGYVPAMRGQDAAAVLVRPDFYVFGRVSVDRLFGGLGSRLRAVALVDATR